MKKMDEIISPTVHWFGTSWGAPICAPDLECEVPIGEPCIHCEVAIAAEDNGFIMAAVIDDEEFGYKRTMRPYHYKCIIEAMGLTKKENNETP